MKLVRYQGAGTIALGVLTYDGSAVARLDTLVDVQTTRSGPSMADFLALGINGLEAAEHAMKHARDLTPVSDVRLLAPVGDPGKILCIGQNYRDHCLEQNQPFPERAILFSKYNTALNDPDATVKLPAVAKEVDYEAELAFVIGGVGGGGRNIPESDAMRHVAGYMCANDVSARDIQQHPAERQWVRGKSPDGFFPIGPTLVTADEVPDPQDLDISLTLNGKTMQSSNTSNLIFTVPYLIAHLSTTMTLLPGDIVSTGTPGGVGYFRNPKVLLQPGDVVSVTVEGLGTLTNSIAAE